MKAFKNYSSSEAEAACSPHLAVFQPSRAEMCRQRSGPNMEMQHEGSKHGQYQETTQNKILVARDPTRRHGTGTRIQHEAGQAKRRRHKSRHTAHDETRQEDMSAIGITTPNRKKVSGKTYRVRTLRLEEIRPHPTTGKKRYYIYLQTNYAGSVHLLGYEVRRLGDGCAP